jgi:NADH-quinone oxidoreductase subunit J
MTGNALNLIYQISFFGIALFAVAAALVVISAKNPVVSAIWLAVCFVAVAGIYALLKAPFLAMVQILVYAGAIMVLFVMIMMLMDLGKIEPAGAGQKVIRAFAAAAGAVVTLVLLVLAGTAGNYKWTAWNEVPVGTSEAMGRLLFTTYLLPFEILSLLLLAAVVAAIYLARRREASQ